MTARLTALLSRLAGREVGRRELILLACALAAGMAARLLFVVLTHDHELVGDEILYDRQVRFMLDGKLFYELQPTLKMHATAVKPPGYPVFLTVLFALTGSGTTRAAALQTLLLGPPTILLTWLLAARLFARPAVALTAVWLAALYPNLGRWEMRFYPEALALPLALLFFVLVLTKPITRRTVTAVGLVVGASLLVRPTSVVLLPGLLAAWWAMAGFRQAALSTAAVVGIAVLCVVPWTVRNYVVLDGFVPISLQDAAAYGVFNDDSANDPDFPWAWRPITTRDRDLLPPPKDVSDPEWRRLLQGRAFDYVKEHPSSLPKALFWNGVVRTWDLQRPSRAVISAPDRAPAWAGVFAYWALLALAAVAIWRLRKSQLPLILMLVGCAAAAALVYTSGANTRYRVPLEPLVVVLAAATASRVFGRTPASPPAARTSPR